MLSAALPTEIAPLGVQCGAVGEIDLVDPTLILWRRTQPYRFRSLLEYYKRAEAARAMETALVSTIVEVDRNRIADFLPPVPKRLIAARNAFAIELQRLITLFASVDGKSVVRIKLEVERGDRCRYFHADQVGLRLLCSYLGPGTEWVPGDFVERRALGSGDNATIVPDPRRVQRLEPYWVGLFKGNLHPDCPGRGCVHRSPPIARKRNVARILLTIDNPDED
jgi:Protein of unknown function (DUF1826)